MGDKVENHEIILQDEHHQQFKIVKVQDVRFDEVTIANTHQWLWVYDHSAEFFPFELWDQLDNASVHQKIKLGNQVFKVIKILTKKTKIRYS
ncbi:hypothetical protein ACIAD2143 [Acinetobacter baylyi ADP1]|uniref:Uncharacterized protein n=1 Tax=Acinetobacter baylyi (strain ATCC 33305 / BD413 / ADP1) TaxID=62977 RepID=Q6FAG7_ACIAD|nr:hypothetical protein F952_01934 [Acinetobacter baylyi DSM 14961 = CIP 107474]CAG68946.1 hypothetical protein ACIAD2143 [Acinetobacter baylyi ADP1]